MAVKRSNLPVALAVNSSTQVPFFTKRMVVTVVPLTTEHTLEGRSPGCAIRGVALLDTRTTTPWSVISAEFFS